MLDHACLFHASSSRPTVNKALDKAYAQYEASNSHDGVIRQFVEPPKKNSVLQITEFILNHRL